MIKFETNKIYTCKRNSGVGYDHCTNYDYYLITRKNEKSIWWKKISITTELFTRATNEKADFNLFDKATEKRSKLSNYDESEFFIDTHESGYQEYIFCEYAEKIE